MSFAHVLLRSAFGFVLASCSSGCFGNDEVIFVEPSIEAPAAALSGSVLGATVTGSFKLGLLLGPRASGPSSVSISSVGITDADNQTLVPGLSLKTSQSFPLTVQPDSDITIDVTFDMDGQTVPMQTSDALCAPSGIRITGNIMDSLQTSATPFSSAIFSPTGCP